MQIYVLENKVIETPKNALIAYGIIALLVSTALYLITRDWVFVPMAYVVVFGGLWTIDTKVRQENDKMKTASDCDASEN